MAFFIKPFLNAGDKILTGTVNVSQKVVPEETINLTKTKLNNMIGDSSSREITTYNMSRTVNAGEIMMNSGNQNKYTDSSKQTTCMKLNNSTIENSGVGNKPSSFNNSREQSSFNISETNNSGTINIGSGNKSTIIDDSDQTLEIDMVGSSITDTNFGNAKQGTEQQISSNIENVKNSGIIKVDSENKTFQHDKSKQCLNISNSTLANADSQNKKETYKHVHDHVYLATSDTTNKREMNEIGTSNQTENITEEKFNLERTISQILPGLHDNDIQALVSMLKNIGVEERNDLKLIDEDDLNKSGITTIQKRKLLRAWNTDETKSSEKLPQIEDTSGIEFSTIQQCYNYSDPGHSLEFKERSFTHDI